MADEALQRGVNSTPTFFVGDQMIVGANYAQLREAIDAALGAQ
jgi:protein-disulfide isomerase